MRILKDGYRSRNFIEVSMIAPQKSKCGNVPKGKK